jgi:hypothetical protein
MDFDGLVWQNAPQVHPEKMCVRMANITGGGEHEPRLQIRCGLFIFGPGCPRCSRKWVLG